MAMTYTSLTAAKGTSGSIANWVSYSLLDLPPILDEAQALIYSLLRCREMRTRKVLSLAVGEAMVALPARFLDPIGRMYSTTYNLAFRHKEEAFITENRAYTTTSGSLGTNPFTTVSGSQSVTVALTGHGFNQESTLVLAGAAAVGGLTLTGAYPLLSVATDSFVIDAGDAATSSATGGGASITYTCNNLTQGIPLYWSIWDEKIHFELSFSTQTTLVLPYYQSLALLSASNPSNFLTDRYPHLLRTACIAAAAEFMKDDNEHQKLSQKLVALIGQIGVENDMGYRGAELDTEIP